MPRRIVRTTTIFAFLTALAAGVCVATAWRRVSSMTLRTGYRIRRCLAQRGPAIRTALLSRAPPPLVESPRADVQLLLHLRAVLGGADDAFGAFQFTFQRPVLG